jgi:hypothetical protein
MEAAVAYSGGAMYRPWRCLGGRDPPYCDALLEFVALYAEAGPAKFERAALRWNSTSQEHELGRDGAALGRPDTQATRPAAARLEHPHLLERLCRV